MTDDAMVEAVARAICAEINGRCTCAEGRADFRVHCDDAERSARAAIRAVSPLIIERCAEEAEAVMASFDRNGDFDEAFGAKSAAVDIRALIQKEPSCAPAGVTSPPR